MESFNFGVMEKTYNDIVAENQALKNANSILKREIKIWRKFMASHFPEYLDVFDVVCETNPDSPETLKNAVKCGCKVISINPVNK